MDPDRLFRNWSRKWDRCLIFITSKPIC